MRLREARSGPGLARESRVVLNNLAELLQATNRLSEAEPLYRRALAIDERVVRPRPPRRRDRPQQPGGVAPGHEPAVGGRAALSPRRWRSTSESYGPDHPDVAIRPQQPGGVAPGHESAVGGRAALSPRPGDRRASRTAPTTPTSRSASTTWRSCSRPRIGWRRPSRSWHAPFASSRDSSDRRATNIPNLRIVCRKLPPTAHRARSWPSPRSPGGSRRRRRGRSKLPPIVPEVERLLGPAKPVADVLTSLDRQYREQGKPGVYFLKPDEPIAPHLDELLRPSGDGLNAWESPPFAGALMPTRSCSTRPRWSSWPTNPHRPRRSSGHG